MFINVLGGIWSHINTIIFEQKDLRVIDIIQTANKSFHDFKSNFDYKNQEKIYNNHKDRIGLGEDLKGNENQLLNVKTQGSNNDKDNQIRNYTNLKKRTNKINPEERKQVSQNMKKNNLQFDQNIDKCKCEKINIMHNLESEI